MTKWARNCAYLTVQIGVVVWVPLVDAQQLLVEAPARPIFSIYVQLYSPQHCHPSSMKGRLHSRASMCGGVKVVRHQLALGWQEWDGGGVGHQDQVKLLKMGVNQGSEPILCQGSFLSRVCKLGKGLVCCNSKSFLHSNHLIFWIKSNLLPS